MYPIVLPILFWWGSYIMNKKNNSFYFVVVDYDNIQAAGQECSNPNFRSQIVSYPCSFSETTKESTVTSSERNEIEFEMYCMVHAQPVRKLDSHKTKNNAVQCTMQCHAYHWIESIPNFND